MAIVTRYFSTTGAGLADGTSWANRAELFSAGAWSTIITGFDFAADSLLAYIGPGTYTASAAISFTTAPDEDNQLFLHGCDSSGNALSPPDYGWKSCEPDWDSSSLPVINITTLTTTALIANNFCSLRLLKLTSSSITSGGLIGTNTDADWCVFENNTNSSAACGIKFSGNMIHNCIVIMSGSSYDAAFLRTNTVTARLRNVRSYGVTGSSGNRRWCTGSASSFSIECIGCTFFNFPGGGQSAYAGGSAGVPRLRQCVLANMGSHAWSRSTNTDNELEFTDCMITGNDGWGLTTGADECILIHNRWRDNTSGNWTGLTNSHTIDNYTTDSDDATEYVDASNATLSLRDYTIKSGATIHGMGFGVAEQVVAGGGVRRTGWGGGFDG